MSAEVSPPGPPQPIWSPDPTATAESTLARFTQFVAGRTGAEHSSYQDLWEWSVEDLNEFWEQVWDFFDLAADVRPGQILASDQMPGARWLPGARLNYAEHALRRRTDGCGGGIAGGDDTVAVISVSEDGTTTTTTSTQMRSRVGALAQWLRTAGVTRGDRVVGYLPNTTPTLVAFLAAASLGAVWSACAQDYGAPGAGARFAQLEPVVLVAADGYLWNGRVHDRRDEVAALQRLLPTLRAVIHVPTIAVASFTTTTPLGSAAAAAAVTEVSWEEATATPAEPRFDRIDADSPLWVLFSSGTTGVPKGIVHSHGGVVLEHHKLLGLHLDASPARPLFWYTTTNWMMWNIVASGLLVDAPIVLYEGSPTYPDPLRLFRIAADHHVATLGVSPGYLLGCAKAGVHPGGDLDLSALRTIGSTGAPLTPASYTWVHDEVGVSVALNSTSGGTDVVTGFAGSSPNTEVWPGELSAPFLGVDLQAWDDAGNRVVGEIGEMVITQPMPSMPVGFWNDPDAIRYSEAYFSTYPGVWRQGDWVTMTDRGTLVISGRSDSTLNRHGVRLGSADIYAVLDTLHEIDDALVIGAELADGTYWLALFVVLTLGSEMTAELQTTIRQAISTQASPRHVPDDVIALTALPHTRTGKKLEVPVKRLIQGHPLATVASRDAVDNYDALAQFTAYAGGPSQRPHSKQTNGGLAR